MNPHKKSGFSTSLRLQLIHQTQLATNARFINPYKMMKLLEPLKDSTVMVDWLKLEKEYNERLDNGKA